MVHMPIAGRRGCIAAGHGKIVQLGTVDAGFVGHELYDVTQLFVIGGCAEIF